jgi:PleD family two-component response regulator
VCDSAGRGGGLDLVVLLDALRSVPKADASAEAELATGVLERLRAVTPAGQAFSAGVATWDGNETSEELIGRADQALYQAKDAGRDRIVVAAEEAQTASQPGPRRLTQDTAT